MTVATAVVGVLVAIAALGFTGLQFVSDGRTRERQEQQDARDREANEARDLRRDAERVAVYVERQSDQPDRAVDPSTRFAVYNRSSKPIADFRLTFNADDPGAKDGTSAASVTISSSVSIAPCMRVLFAIPAGVKLSDFPALAGKRLYAQDPILTFYQSDRLWQTSSTGKLQAEGPGFPGPKVRSATDIGIARILRQDEPTGCGSTGD